MPTRERKKSSRRKRSQSAPAILRSPRKRKKWSEAQMRAAMDAISKGMSVKRAATEHGVPRSTLQDRKQGNVIHGTNPGAKPYLNKAEEAELTEYIITVGELGFGKTRKQIKGIAEKVASEKKALRKDKITNGWFNSFIKRHPELSLRKGDSTCQARMNAMNNRVAIEQYFAILKECMEKEGLFNKPAQIYNFDEVGMPLDHRSPHVVVKKGQKKVRYRSSGNKSQVTALVCVNAAGSAMPPYIIFDAKNLNLDWTEGKIPGTTYGLSSNGWIDMELFRLWFKKHFLQHAVSARPLLLLMDGHSSHYNPETIRFAKENNVILFTLVPHTTHEMQPLDTAVFSSLKSHWQSVCHDYLQKHPGKVITKYQFSHLFSAAWGKALIPLSIIGGFKYSGVYPFNPTIVLDKCPIANPVIENDAVVAHTSTNSNSNDDSTDEEDEMDFTKEEEANFSKRFDEGYDIYDPKYISWLKINHPEVTLSPNFSFLPPNPEPEQDCDSNPSLESSTNLDSDGDSPTPATIDSPTPVTTDEACADGNVTSNSHGDSPTPALTDEASDEGLSFDGNATTVNKTPSSSGHSSVDSAERISKYLIQYVPETPKRKKSSLNRVMGQRVLTSTEGLALLKEKEEKKQKKAQEIEQRKQERENKKKEKEAEAKRKADEKLKSITRNSGRKRSTPCTRAASKKSKSNEHSIDTEQPCASTSNGKAVTSTPKGSNQTEEEPEEEDAICCECNVSYADDIRCNSGEEWVQCACDRWIHTKCVDEVIVDADGNERICSFCVV